MNSESLPHEPPSDGDKKNRGLLARPGPARPGNSPISAKYQLHRNERLHLTLRSSETFVNLKQNLRPWLLQQIGSLQPSWDWWRSKVCQMLLYCLQIPKQTQISLRKYPQKKNRCFRRSHKFIFRLRMLLASKPGSSETSAHWFKKR